MGAGLKLNAPMIGKGDYFQIQGTYTQGATRYANMTAFAWDYSKYSGNTYGFGYQTDAVYGGTIAGANASNLELTTAWAVNAAYTHHWDPAWKTTLWGSYFAQSYSTLGNAMICSAGGAGAGAGTAAVAAAGCNMDWQTYGAGLRTEWAISSSFQIGVEVLYANLQSAQTPGGLIGLPVNGTKPAGVYTVSDQDIWAFRLRVNRTFYP